MRRDFHRNPELSNREERTARVIAEKLRALKLEVRTGVAQHGIVAVLKAASRGLWLRGAPIWMRCRWKRTLTCRTSLGLKA
ncbi:MAG TPA: hypothetical protein VM120_07110 [Bryobacteraceae bacterium]|nr:hypothetical protein [Bryobacteraceae bacterium]